MWYSECWMRRLSPSAIMNEALLLYQEYRWWTNYPRWHNSSIRNSPLHPFFHPFIADNNTRLPAMLQVDINSRLSYAPKDAWSRVNNWFINRKKEHLEKSATRTRNTLRKVKEWYSQWCRVRESVFLNQPLLKVRLVVVSKAGRVPPSLGGLDY